MKYTHKIKQHMHNNTTECIRLVTSYDRKISSSVDMFGDPSRSVMEVSGWELVLARKGRYYGSQEIFRWHALIPSEDVLVTCRDV